MISGLRRDPLPALLECGNPAVEYFTRRDLLGEKAGPVRQLWDLPAAQKILRRQREDGAWKYPGGQERIRSQQDYNQYETFRQLGFLVEQYGFDRKHEAVTRAAEFLFSFQTPGGDFRGIYGNQYTPNYSAGIMELLIKAGYARDPRVDEGFAWLLSARQDDGGWAIPLRTRGRNLDVISMRAAPLETDPARPFSWLATGVVLRAFAAHPRKRRSEAARQAGELLLSSLSQKGQLPGPGQPRLLAQVHLPLLLHGPHIRPGQPLAASASPRTGRRWRGPWPGSGKGSARTVLWDLKIQKGRTRTCPSGWPCRYAGCSSVYTDRSDHGGRKEEAKMWRMKPWAVWTASPSSSWEPSSSGSALETDPAAQTDDGHSLKFFWYVMGAWFIGLTLVVYAGMIYFVARSGRKAVRMRQDGLRGVATVISSGATGGEMNNMPQMEMELQVNVEGKPTYGVTHREYVNPVNLPALQAGAQVAVLVDEDDPHKLIIDWR